MNYDNKYFAELPNEVVKRLEEVTHSRITLDTHDWPWVLCVRKTFEVSNPLAFSQNKNEIINDMSTIEDMFRLWSDYKFFKKYEREIKFLKENPQLLDIEVLGNYSTMIEGVKAFQEILMNSKIKNGGES